MIKELKYLFFIITIFLFIFFTLKYYFSNENKKKSFRSFKQNNDKVIDYSEKLILLKNDTNNIIEYNERKIDKNKKNYNFWKLINNNE
tara:strand:+ start:797 stop:1060 length:264 start_codon:yes stop_codon:yes gene_type:complete